MAAGCRELADRAITIKSAGADSGVSAGRGHRRHGRAWGSSLSPTSLPASGSSFVPGSTPGRSRCATRPTRAGWRSTSPRGCWPRWLGEILVSRTEHDLVVGSDITLDDRGTHRLAVRKVPGSCLRPSSADLPALALPTEPALVLSSSIRVAPDPYAAETAAKVPLGHPPTVPGRNWSRMGSKALTERCFSGHTTGGDACEQQTSWSEGRLPLSRIRVRRPHPKR